MYKPPHWSFPKCQFFHTSESRSSTCGLLHSSRQDTLPASADHESICPTLMTPDGRLLSPCRQGNRGYKSFVSQWAFSECYRAFTPRGSPCQGRKAHFIHCRSLLSRLKASIMWAEWNRARVPPRGSPLQHGAKLAPTPPPASTKGQSWPGRIQQMLPPSSLLGESGSSLR